MMLMLYMEKLGTIFRVVEFLTKDLNYAFRSLRNDIFTMNGE